MSFKQAKELTERLELSELSLSNTLDKLDIANKKFTATQYALLTSLMGIPRVVASAATGFMVESLGWFTFYIFCTLIAIPGMLLLLKFAPWNSKELSA